MAQADADEGNTNSRLSTDEKRELAELRKHNRRLEVENEILKRAVAYFARENAPKVVFPLVRELADDGFDVAVTCRVLNLRRQGYYEWRSGVKSARILENEMLLKHIEKIHEGSRGTYGWPRVHAELRLGLGLGMTVNHERVARLMREAGRGVGGCPRVGWPEGVSPSGFHRSRRDSLRRHYRSDPERDQHRTSCVVGVLRNRSERARPGQHRARPE
jgi:hypothetical protein